METMTVKATSIKFKIDDTELQTSIEIQGNLAEFFVNVIMASGLSKPGLLYALMELIESKDNKITKTENKEIIVSSKHPAPFKPRPASNKSVMQIRI